MSEFLEKFADLFDETDPKEIKLETIFKDLEEWSSLSVLLVVSMVDDEYGVNISGEDIQNAKAVNDIYNIIIAKK